ncbi:unnamed protein product [Mucor circinelloides]
MNGCKLINVYLNQTRQKDWDFNTAVNLVKSENNHTDEQAFSKLDLILKENEINWEKASHWRNNWKSLIKAYNNSTKEECRSNSSSYIGTQFNTSIKSLKTKKIVNYAHTAVLTADSAASSAAVSGDEYFLDDPFAEEPPKMSSLITRRRQRDWKSEAAYQPKLHLQNLMFYNIVYFTSTNDKDGTHCVYGDKLAREKSLYKVEYKSKRNIDRYVHELLKSNNQGGFYLKSFKCHSEG